MNISIQPLGCGTLTAAEKMFETGGGDDRIALPVPSWLIHHPDGIALFDCGMHEDLIGASPYLDLVSIFFEVDLPAERLITNALASVELAPDDIDVVVLSHLHFDHVGGLHQIPDARVIVQSDEWATASDDELAAANGFVTTDYRLGHDVVTVDGEHDLFGDGRISCIPTPGHTPGHQSLRVRLADREVVLCGDCAYFERTLAGGPLPPIGHDHDQQRESIRRLREIGAGGALLIPGHDPDLIAALPDRLV